MINQTRSKWVENLHKIAFPVIDNAAKGKLHDKLPVTKEQKQRGVAYLEAIGRTVAGLAPWLELDSKKITDVNEKELQSLYRELVRKAMANSVDPKGPDYCVWNKSDTNMMQDQPIVDAAFFASAILKAPHQLWELQLDKVKKDILNAFDRVLLMRPGRCNWLMFTAMIEACRYKLTGIGDSMRIDCALAMHHEWYKGDGFYGDGDSFVMNYYNSYVILPMLEEVTRVANNIVVDKRFRLRAVNALSRHSEILERFIAPDGSFPCVGRSITYRMGAFHALAHAAWLGVLPKNLPANQVRCALSKVMDNIMSAPTLFDSEGFLTIGLYGQQEALGEGYINHGSVYLTSLIFLPLGLEPADEFWKGKDTQITWEKAWRGQNIEKDISMESRRKKIGYFARLFAGWKR